MASLMGRRFRGGPREGGGRGPGGPGAGGGPEPSGRLQGGGNRQVHCRPVIPSSSPIDAMVVAKIFANLTHIPFWVHLNRSGSLQTRMACCRSGLVRVSLTQGPPVG